MQKSTQSILISCLIIVIISCLCLSVLSVLGAAYFIISGAGISGLSPSGPAAEPNTRPADTQEQMDLIEEQVISLRGLQPNGTVIRDVLSPEQLRQRVQDDFLKDYSEEDARNDSLSLHIMGLLEADFDLRQLLIDLYSEQIAGFYDDETKEMYVIQGAGFLGPERLTYAHEYVHALQDQTYNFETGLNYNDESCEIDTERCAAISALVEGDASTLEMEWFTTYGTSEDGQEINDFYATFDSPIYDASPEFLQKDLIFPYSQGADFVESLIKNGGWEAVDAAYANLPVSTEQILHPDRYPEDLPQPVSLPDLSAALGAGWVEIDKGVMGEWYTFMILAYGHSPAFRMSESQARQAAEGWGGDSYVVFYQPETSALAMVVQTVWDTAKDAAEFSATFEKYGDRRFGSGEKQTQGRTWSDGDLYSEIITQDDQTTWLIAPDAETGAALRQALQLP